MAVRSSSLLIAVAAAVATFLLLTGGKSDEQAAQVPSLPLEGVEQRITPEGLGEHLDALQRIANENDGTRATGTPGERATADYLAGRLRAAGYRVQVQEVRQPVFRERTSPRLTVPGGRQYEVATLRFSGSGSVAGTVRKTGSGCARASFNSLQRGEIALVRRGGCTFRTKVLGAQRAGAAAVIVSDPDPVRGSLERSVRIPAIAVGDRGAGLTGKRVRVRVQARDDHLPRSQRARRVGRDRRAAGRDGRRSPRLGARGTRSERQRQRRRGRARDGGGARRAAVARKAPRCDSGSGARRRSA